VTWPRVSRAVGAAGVGGVLVAVAQSPTGPALAPTVGPMLAATLAVLAGLAVVVVGTVVVLVLTGALSRNRDRQGNATAMVCLFAYAVHRRCRPDLDLTPRRGHTAPPPRDGQCRSRRYVGGPAAGGESSTGRSARAWRRACRSRSTSRSASSSGYQVRIPEQRGQGFRPGDVLAVIAALAIAGLALDRCLLALPRLLAVAVRAAARCPRPDQTSWRGAGSRWESATAPPSRDR
jgi:hypothetical protein